MDSTQQLGATADRSADEPKHKIKNTEYKSIGLCNNVGDCGCELIDDRDNNHHNDNDNETSDKLALSLQIVATHRDESSEACSEVQDAKKYTEYEPENEGWHGDFELWLARFGLCVDSTCENKDEGEYTNPSKKKSKKVAYRA